MDDEQGFTLIEVMIAMAISVIVLGVTYVAYSNQMRTFVAQGQIAEIQQNLRASMYLLERGIKSAGYDPMESGFARILKAGIGEFHYEADLNGNMNDFSSVALNESPPGSPNPDTNERVWFRLRNDADSDGIPDDNLPCNFVRETWNGGGQPMAENIEALNFVYLDEDRNPIGPFPSIDPGMDDIRTIQVTIVARSARVDPGHTDTGPGDPLNPAITTGYYNLQNERILDAPNDHFHRRVLSRSIDCPNIF